ncbi:hypothetical protein [Noviherbaspirillum humi]|uniref:hypothetical protein n=1 Tax=Noviherbaspirillum humi TaxID=1688639 RepID=UPI001160B7D6|nr:hypothetical protein [Noviherbaspirillum humi]
MQILEKTNRLRDARAAGGPVCISKQEEGLRHYVRNGASKKVVPVPAIAMQSLPIMMQQARTLGFARDGARAGPADILD